MAGMMEALQLKKSQKWPEGLACTVSSPGWGVLQGPGEWGEGGGGRGEGSDGLKGELQSSFIRCCHTGEQRQGLGRGP